MKDKEKILKEKEMELKSREMALNEREAKNEAKKNNPAGSGSLTGGIITRTVICYSLGVLSGSCIVAYYLSNRK